MSTIDNYNAIKDQINETALKCGRNREEIRIVAVSKTFPAGIIQDAVNSGIRIFGENRIQESKEKFSEISGDYELHMVGHLQSNKTKDAVELFSLIHSIDKISTAQKLNSDAEKSGKIQKILLQLKTTDEVTKNGADPAYIQELTEAVLLMKNLKLEGIMSIGPNTDNIKLIEKSFIQTAKTLDIINNRFSLKLRELSMGMSGDFKIAIKEGATLLRIGSAIFGNR